MRRVILPIIVMLSVALPCVAVPTVTNAVPSVVSVTVATNAPVAKLPRQQCEAITKSGNRCKRNAIPGERLCRQHLKIVKRKLVGSGAVH